MVLVPQWFEQPDWKQEEGLVTSVSSKHGACYHLAVCVRQLTGQSVLTEESLLSSTCVQKTVRVLRWELPTLNRGCMVCSCFSAVLVLPVGSAGHLRPIPLCVILNHLHKCHDAVCDTKVDFARYYMLPEPLSEVFVCMVHTFSACVSLLAVPSLQGLRTENEMLLNNYNEVKAQVCVSQCHHLPACPQAVAHELLSYCMQSVARL